jgi:hypothetical protein
VTEAKKRKRPSAKEARARMARAVATPSPISRAEEEPDGGPVAGGEEAGDAHLQDAGEEGQGTRRGRRGGRDGSPVEREKLVRLSVDVPRAQHRFLRVEAAQAGTTGMAVVRALISEMEADEQLAERVRGRLESE